MRMSGRTLGTRLRRVEQQVAGEEYAQYDRFYRGVVHALASSLDGRLTDHGLNERIRARLLDIVCPNHSEKVQRHVQKPQDVVRKRNEPMSSEQVRFALWSAAASREDLISHAIEPMLQALQQALEELVEDVETRGTIAEDFRTGYCRVLNEFRPERRNSS